MRVKMIMDFIARTGGGARKAQSDIKGVKDAAKGLDGAKGGQRLSRDFLSLASGSRRATQAMRETKVAADALGRSSGPSRLRRMLADQQALVRSTRMLSPASAASALTPGLKGAIGGYFTARAAIDSVKRFAEAERAITRIGVTADASKEEVAGIGETAFKVAQEVAMPYEKVVQGLDVLVAQGRDLKDAMGFLPSVARTASAAGAEVEDIARTADSVGSNFKIAGDQMQRAFDIMAAGGKAGQFELKDMARYLPSLGPAAAAAGFQGEEGLRDLVSTLQIMRKGSGTSEEAATSMQNVLQKMMSEETAKRFKKFGVDLPKAMENARKEGRNLVEVFEELTNKALKGDLSKIPQLINDMEFARGIRALTTYRGEWQKLSGTISKTAAGSVQADLGKVTDNLQARLDRLANTYQRRMRQIGGMLSDIITPIDTKIDELFSGKNETFNQIGKPAALKSADIIARQEMRTGERGEYDPDTRRLADARREMLERQAFDDKVAKLDAEISTRAGLMDWSKPRGSSAMNDRLESTLERFKAERDMLISLRKAIDEANLSLVENEAQKKRLNTRFNRPVEQPGSITPGLKSFGFGPQGQNELREPLPVETETTAPLPPRRPDSLPKPVPMLKNLKEIFSFSGEVDLGGAGLTIAESLANGLKSGTGSVTNAAGGMNDAVRNAVGADLTTAGQQAAESYAAGLRKGVPAVAAAAQALGAAAVNSANRNAMARGGSKTISGALHDGVE
ncbi:phage tail tape measure protein [Bosea sp. (in: a-proteobacteria)]